MRKIYVLSAALFLGFTANAQRNINLQASITAPNAGATVTYNVATTFTYVFKNLGPTAIAATDTILYVDPLTPSGQAFFVTGKSKAMNDTIMITKSATLVTAPNGAYNWCINSQAWNRTNPFTETDTSNNDACRNLNFVGFPTTGIKDIVAARDINTVNLGIAPNPATAEIKFDFVAINNSEVVLSITDLTGRVIRSFNYGKAFVGKNNYTYNVAELPTGLYIVELNQDGQRAIGKLNKD